MTIARWLVTLICFVAGYWVVSKLVGGSGTARRKETNPDPGPGREAAPPERGNVHERATLTNWYRILGVPENAGKEQISAAYKRKIAQYHPDKVAQMGDEIRDVADAKSKQINAAYDIGMRLFR